MSGLSLVAESGGYSLVAMRELLVAVVSPVQSTALGRVGSIVEAHGLSCPMACGTFPDRGSNPCPLHCKADSSQQDHQGNPRDFKFLFSYKPSLYSF